MLTPADMPAGYRLVRTTPAEVVIEDDPKPDLGLEADIDAAGTVRFKVRTEDVNQRRGSVRGRVLFDLMLRHFGAGVTAIRGLWLYGTNLDEFNRLTATGVPTEQAAADVWTGRQADRHGFRTVTRRQLIGRPGYYGLAEFEFTR